MMTKDEARRVLERELRSRKLAKPMMLEQLNVFCEEMYKQLEFIRERTTGGPSENGLRIGSLRTCRGSADPMAALRGLGSRGAQFDLRIVIPTLAPLTTWTICQNQKVELKRLAE
jgi:hypothetical protein